MAKEHQLLDIRRNGAFIFSDILLIDYRQQRLADLLIEIAKQKTHLETLIRRYMKDDDRMLGQEKANVANILHMLIRNLAAVHLRVYDMEHAASYANNPEVTEGKDGFIIKGHMNPAEVTVRFSLHDWVNSVLEPKVLNLIQGFQDAAKDHKISTAERVQLLAQVGTMLVQCVQAFYLIRTGAVFT